jgi:excisionase family DNA binding protein
MAAERHPLHAHVWLTRRESAEYARVSLSTIDRALRRGELPRYRVGGGVRIKREDVDEWLHRGAMVLLLVLVLALATLPLHGCTRHHTQHRGHYVRQPLLAITAERTPHLRPTGRRKR